MPLMGAAILGGGRNRPIPSLFRDENDIEDDFSAFPDDPPPVIRQQQQLGRGGRGGRGGGPGGFDVDLRRGAPGEFDPDFEHPRSRDEMGGPMRRGPGFGRGGGFNDFESDRPPYGEDWDTNGRRGGGGPLDRDR